MGNNCCWFPLLHLTTSISPSLTGPIYLPSHTYTAACGVDGTVLPFQTQYDGTEGQRRGPGDNSTDHAGQLPSVSMHCSHGSALLEMFCKDLGGERAYSR